MFIFSYLKLNDEIFKERIYALYSMLDKCTFCLYVYKINRIIEEKWKCNSDSSSNISPFKLNFGEESSISRINDLENPFFSKCLSKYVYSKNYLISQCCEGCHIIFEELPNITICLKKHGTNIVNFVFIAKNYDLKIPIVNSSFEYEKEEFLKLTDEMII